MDIISYRYIAKWASGFSFDLPWSGNGRADVMMFSGIFVGHAVGAIAFDERAIALSFFPGRAGAVNDFYGYAFDNFIHQEFVQDVAEKIVSVKMATATDAEAESCAWRCRIEYKILCP